MKIIYKDGHVDECPQDQELHVIRHTAAHIMAQAIKRLYPEADFAFGPATENGFYYDVDLGDTKLTDDDLANIEKEMRKICKENLAIKPFILPRDEAVKLMEERQEHYKIEHMADLADETEFSFFQQGEYVDMCIGPHLTYTKALKAFKITQQSGAYWKNDKENKMLTRINGVAFRNQDSHIVNELLHRCNMSFFHNGTTVGVFSYSTNSYQLLSSRVSNSDTSLANSSSSSGSSFDLIS